MSNNYDFKGKYAIVTGASTGIGNAIALELAKAGCNLALGALPAEKKMLDDFVLTLEKDYRIKARAFAVDLAEEDGPKTFYEEARKCMPHLDILVNNAGIDMHGYFHQIPFGIQDKLLRINVRAYMALMHLSLPEMIERKQGRIMNTVSMGAFQPDPFLATYGASKAFLQSFSEAVDHELQGTGVSVHTFNPNNVATPLYDKLPQDWGLAKTNPPISPAFAARKAVNGLKRGTKVIVPTLKDWFTAFVVPRLLPRSVIVNIAYSLLKTKQLDEVR
jgi:uncharacterized protein